MNRPLSSLHRQSVLLQAVATAFTLGGIAAAQPPGREGGRDGMFRNPLLTLLDTDGNGEVSAEELAGATAALKKLDANGDGKLTADELRPPFAGGGGFQPGGPGGFPGGPGGFPGGAGRGQGGGGGQAAEEMVARLMEFDENKDGKVSAAELPARMQGILTRADTDKDGFANRDELLAAARAQGQGEGRREGGRGEGERGGDRGFRGGDPAAFVERMFQFDADKDGRLSREELTAMAAQLPGGRGGPGDGERREGDRPGGGERREAPGRRPPTE